MFFRHVYLAFVGWIFGRCSDACRARFGDCRNHHRRRYHRAIDEKHARRTSRAYTQRNDIVKARIAYQDFLTLWKDADPDIPIYQQAKAEYAKLQ